MATKIVNLVVATAGGLQIPAGRGIFDRRLFVPLVFSGRLWSPPTFTTIGQIDIEWI
jgi:hypothetical protein